MKLFGHNTASDPARSRWTLHGLEVEVNALVVKVKLIFGRKQVPNSLSAAKEEAVSRTVYQEISRLEARGAPPPALELPESLPVVATSRNQPAMKPSPRRSRNQPTRGSPRRRPTPRSKALHGEIISYVPVATSATGFAVLQPTNVMADTVRQLAGHYRQKAIKKGDIPTALAAAWVEQEATKAAYATPHSEPGRWY